MNTSLKHTRREWKATLAFAFALALGLGTAGMAQAATEGDPSYGNVDTSKTGSLIIHKGQSNSSTSDNNKGSVSGTAPTGFSGLAGVKFTAYKIADIDLGTSAGWTAASNLTIPATACTAGSGGTPSLSGHTLGSGTETTITDSNGLTTLSGLAVAAYLVCETTSPSNVVDKAQPFVVTIPFPDKDIKGWRYNVNVWPKNGVATITKSVSAQTDLALGSVAKFPVTSTLASIASNANYKYFIVSDPLDSRLTNGGVDSVTLDGATVAPSNYTVHITGNTVSVAFTQSGLALLKSNAGKQLVVTFKGTVASLGNGVIKNTATLYGDTQVSENPPTEPPVTPPENPPGIPTNEVQQNWGDLVISKIADDQNKSPLQGAKFKVYEASDPYAATCTTAKTGSALAISGNDEFTTGSNGLATVDGLFVSDSVNAPINASARCYVVEEVEAPVGYVLPSTPLTAVKVTIGQTSGFDVQIINTTTTVPTLPQTGANGQLVMMLVGGALILIAAGTVVIVRARRRSQRS